MVLPDDAVPVLNDGFIRLVDVMGDDNSVVRAARVGEVGAALVLHVVAVAVAGRVGGPQLARYRGEREVAIGVAAGEDA